jgi:pimeloyl-ACP methyl ester carboxylesterase
MPTAEINGASIYYEVTGSGFPLLFSHEFAGSHESWEAQVRFFGRYYEVITYNCRGYPPSSVPEGPNAYSQDIAVEDVFQLLRHLGIEKAHVAGLSMGGNVALNFGLTHPELCRSLVVAGCGAGTVNREEEIAAFEETARRLESEGMAAVAEFYSRGPTRLPFLQKDPRGWREFFDLLRGHSTEGSSRTLRGIQIKRPTIYQLEEQLDRLEVPTLIMVGDEDEPCLEPGFFMKRHIRNSGLAIFPKTGHTINLEEPDAFNRTVMEFLFAVEHDAWKPRKEVTTNLLPADARPTRR